MERYEQKQHRHKKAYAQSICNKMGSLKAKHINIESHLILELYCLIKYM